MEMQAHLSQQDIAQVRAGMPAGVTPVGSQTAIAGNVWQVSPVIDPQSRLGAVRIAIPYTAAIKPGGFAEARITAGATSAPLLPGLSGSEPVVLSAGPFLNPGQKVNPRRQAAR